MQTKPTMPDLQPLQVWIIFTDAETEAQIMVNDYEQAHDTTDLWKKVNAASKAILSKSYECGMMTQSDL